jgi:hypothetical protein
LQRQPPAGTIMGDLMMAPSDRRAVWASAAALVLLTLAVVACSKEAPASNHQGSYAGTDPEPLFRAVQDDLIATCGGPNGTCHVRGSYQQAPTWLGGPDPYVTIKKYRGVLPATKEVGDSILLTQVTHAGPTLADAPNDLFGRVSDWLTAEVPGPPLPNTGAFSVQSGFNSVPLATVAPGLSNARLTFLATELNGTLSLTALQIRAPDDAEVKIDSPFFVVLPRNGKVKPDPDTDGFKGQLDVPPGASVDLFDGSMVLLRWDPTGRLKVAFQSVATSPGQAAPTGCTALDLFKSSALPAMNRVVTVRPLEGTTTDNDGGAPADLGPGSCLGCHAANDAAPGPAVKAMDLRNASTDPATACAQAKLWINRKDKSKSVILLNPIGQANQVHPMDPISATDPIETGIKAWVDAEQ